MANDSYTYLTLTILSFIMSNLIVLVYQRHSLFGVDGDHGPQKVHVGSVPRVGGIAIFLGSASSLAFIKADGLPTLTILIATALPVFLTGLCEDFTNAVSAKVRLTASLISGGLFCFITGYSITNVGIEAVHSILSISIISVSLTVLAIAALTNAFNIIDGLNGLSAGTAIINLFGFGILAGYSNDLVNANICFILAALIFGFLICNFPYGKIFLGDGGAYILGAMIAGLAIMLPEKNYEISPFAILLIIIFPIYELLRSVTRRVLATGLHAFTPDNKHLHSLLFKVLETKTNLSRSMQNSLAASLVLILPLFCCFWSIMFFDNALFLIIGIFGFFITYETVVFKLTLTMGKQNRNP